MPIYEYQCKKCGAVSEFLVYGSQAEGLACTSCGEPDWKKYCRRPMSTPLRPAAPASPWAARQGRSAAHRPALPEVAAPRPFEAGCIGTV